MHQPGGPVDQSDVGEPLTKLSLYREFLAEREEILRHQWVESEKAGQDIGFEEALVSWVVRHRAEWRRARRNRTAVSSLE